MRLYIGTDLTGQPLSSADEEKNMEAWKMALLEYKCPNCGGAIQFNPGTQEMVCPYCDSVMDVEALRAMDEKLEHGQETENIAWDYQGDEWQ